MSQQLTLVENKVSEVGQLLPQDFAAKAFGGDRRELFFALRACMQDPNLQKCSPQSIADSIVEADAVGLSFNPVLKQANLVPRYNSRTKQYECTFQAQYRGVQLLLEPEMTIICSDVVRVGDRFEHVNKPGFPYVHVKALPMPGEDYDPNKPGGMGKPGAIYAAYAIARRNGEEVWRLLNLHDLEEKIRQSASSFDKETGRIKPGSYYDKSPAGMFMKSAILALAARYPIKSAALNKVMQMEREVENDWEEIETREAIIAPVEMIDDEANAIREKYKAWFNDPARTQGEINEAKKWRAANDGNATPADTKAFLMLMGGW